MEYGSVIYDYCNYDNNNNNNNNNNVMFQVQG